MTSCRQIFLIWSCNFLVILQRELQSEPVIIGVKNCMYMFDLFCSGSLGGVWICCWSGRWTDDKCRRCHNWCGEGLWWLVWGKTERQERVVSRQLCKSMFVLMSLILDVCNKHFVSSNWFSVTNCSLVCWGISGQFGTSGWIILNSILCLFAT